MQVHCSKLPQEGVLAEVQIVDSPQLCGFKHACACAVSAWEERCSDGLPFLNRAGFFFGQSWAGIDFLRAALSGGQNRIQVEVFPCLPLVPLTLVFIIHRYCT